MSPNTNDRNDSKLLLTVAGVVVAGAVGIALLAGLGVIRQDDEQNVRKRHAPSTRASVAAPALPARHETVVAAPLSIEENLPGSTAGKLVTIEIDPSANFVEVAMAAYEERDFATAIAYLEAEVDARPGRSWPQYLLGLSRWKDGSLDGAVEAMQRAAEIDPTSIKTFVNLSRIQNDRGDFDAALAAAETALTIDEKSGSALHLKGRSLRNLGRVDEAIEAIQASLEAAPDDAWVQNLLGLTLLERGSAYEAIPVLQRAAEQLPDVAFVNNNLGMALEHDGRRAEAVAAYRRAVDADAGHERATINLARLEPTVPQTEAAEAEVHVALLSTPPEEEPQSEAVATDDPSATTEPDESGVDGAAVSGPTGSVE